MSKRKQRTQAGPRPIAAQAPIGDAGDTGTASVATAPTQSAQAEPFADRHDLAAVLARIALRISAQ